MVVGIQTEYSLIIYQCLISFLVYQLHYLIVPLDINIIVGPIFSIICTLTEPLTDFFSMTRSDFSMENTNSSFSKCHKTPNANATHFTPTSQTFSKPHYNEVHQPSYRCSFRSYCSRRCFSYPRTRARMFNCLKPQTFFTH